MFAKEKVWASLFVFLLYFGVKAQQEDARWTCGSFNAIIEIREDSFINIKPDTPLLHVVEPLSSLNYSNNLYFSNSVDISDINGILVSGTENLLHPVFRNRYSSGPVAPDFTILLPKKDGEFYTINKSCDGTIVDAVGAMGPNFTYFGVVDYNSMKVTSSKNKLREDTLQVVSSSFLASTRHANGRDFWIVEKAWKGNRFYIYRTTPDTIVLEHIQVIGDSTGEWDVYGGGRFSPKGDKLAFTCSTQFPQIFDFDRCSGRLSNPIKLLTPSIDRNGTQYPVSVQNPRGGLSVNFSPSGRFLYFNTLWRIDQYDMWKQHPDSIVASRYVVAQWDSTYLNTGACATYEPFNRSLNVINGKLYFAVFNPWRCQYLHEITYPDSLGSKCGFKLFYQETKGYINSSNPLPNLPHYSLKAKVGSGCDTAFTTGLGWSEDLALGFEVYPNPASASVRVTAGKQGYVVLYDMLGKEVLRMEAQAGEQSIAIGHLMGGIYQAVLQAGSQRAVRRLVVW